LILSRIYLIIIAITEMPIRKEIIIVAHITFLLFFIFIFSEKHI